MKKYLFLAALVGVAFTSCVRNEEFAPKTQKEISFEVANYVQSTRVGAFDTNEEFGAYAWVTDGGVTTQLMDEETVSYGTTSLDHDKNDATPSLTSYWKTATTYYWPLEGTVDFICYYPTTTVPTIDYKYEGNDTYKYTDYVVGTDDLMYADKAVRYSSNVANYNGFTGVPTLFRHALAKLNFKVQNGNYDDGVYYWRITVKKITASIYKKGSVTLQNEKTPANADQAVWSLPSNGVWTPTDPAALVEYEWDPASDVVLNNGDLTDFDAKTVYVLPQTLVAGKQTVTVSYTIDQIRKSDSTVISSKDYTPTLNLYSNTLEHWKMNKNITYTLSFNPKGEMILFAPAVEDWGTATGSVVVM